MRSEHRMPIQMRRESPEHRDTHAYLFVCMRLTGAALAKSRISNFTFYRFFGLSWETSTIKNYHPEDSEHSGSRRIEFSSKSTTFLMWQFLWRSNGSRVMEEVVIDLTEVLSRISSQTSLRSLRGLLIRVVVDTPPNTVC